MFVLYLSTLHPSGLLLTMYVPIAYYLLNVAQARLHDAHLREVTPEGYTHRCRYVGESVSKGRAKRGGGVGCLVDERFETNIVPTPKYSAFEHFLVKIDFSKIQLNIVTIYCPPNLSISQFLSNLRISSQI